MARSILSLAPPRPAQGDPPGGWLDFPLVTRKSQGGAKSLARETTAGTRATQGMYPCAGLRELVLPEEGPLKAPIDTYPGTSKRPSRPTST